MHTRGNHITEILQSVENRESSFRHRTGKNKATTSQTKRSLFQEYFHGFSYADLGLNITKPLLISKSYEYFKKKEINPKRLESYLLDSLWNNLQNPIKFEETTPLFQTHQQPISSPVHIPPQNPPVLKNTPTVPNPTSLMAARFAPLAFPVVLNDLPQNYSWRIYLYDGEGKFIARQHMDIF